jgi:hypothetical protein
LGLQESRKGPGFKPNEMQVGKTLLLALCQMSLSWGLPAGLSDRVSALVFPNNKKKNKKEEECIQKHTHPPKETK